MTRALLVIDIQNDYFPGGKFPLWNPEAVLEKIPRILAAAATAPVVVKHYADSFEQTTLAETLAKLGVTELLICGMMTQNCITHTAISKAAEKYDVTLLADCCTTVDEMIHHIALNGISTRVKVVLASTAL